MKILVIQQKMIGDVLVSSILCNNLKKQYPESTIAYMVNAYTIPVIENNPNIDSIIVFKDEFKDNKFDFLKFLFQIRKSKYDIVIDAYGKIESNLVTLFSGAKTKIGFFKPYSKSLYHYTINEIDKPTTNAGTAIENRLNLLKPLNFSSALDYKPFIVLTDEEIKNGKQILEKFNVDFSKKIYMIGVLGSGNNKTYPFEYMAEILDMIVEKTNATLLFNYIPSQENEAKEIYNLCLSKTQENIKIDLIPKSIREFLSVTYYCNALIGNEGGAVNMAKAINIPTFTIFSTWIIKEAWNSFEDGKLNVSVHLKDFRPDLYGDKTPKEMMEKALELYQELKPEMIKPLLETYLIKN
jgi:ADP-heptose:LPS heptosyltransferase